MLTFSLIVVLLFPAGDTMRFEFGASLTREQCDTAVARTQIQLEQTLSTASVYSVSCEPERSA